MNKINIRISLLFVIFSLILMASSCGGGGGGGGTSTLPTTTGSAQGYVYIPYGSEAARVAADTVGYKAYSGATVKATCGSTTKNGTSGTNGYFKLSSLPTGTCTISIQISGYVTQQNQVTISANTTTTVGGTEGVKMTPNTFGTITVTSNVSGAAIMLDGENTGVSIPSSLSYTFGYVAPGTHVVLISKTGYEAVTGKQVAVTAGYQANVEFQLSPSGNRAPVANAGADGKGFAGTKYRYDGWNGEKYVYTPQSIDYTLDGSGSSDADGDAMTYKWEQTSGTTVTLADDTASKTTFIPTSSGTYIFKLTVNDVYGHNSSDYVNVEINKIEGKLAIVSAEDQTGTDIFSLNADGTNFTRLTNNSYYDGSPEWSPDGTKILYTTNPSGDETTYYVATMNADGSGVNVTAVQGSGLDWSPSGNNLLGYTKYSGVLEIYEYSTDGTNPVRLTTTGLTKGFGMYSRDGTKILFNQSYGGDKYQVMVMDSDGSNLTRLTNDNSIHFYINWTNDNKVLYTTTTALGSNHVLYAMNSDGTSSELWPVPSGINDVEQPVMTDDGNFIFYSDDDLKLHVMYSDGSADLNLGVYGISPDYNANE